MITWIVSSTIMILFVLMIRKIFRKKIRPALQYALWLPVLLRLLVPVTPLESGLSIMNLVPEEIRNEIATDSIEQGYSDTEYARPMAEGTDAEQTDLEDNTAADLQYAEAGSDYQKMDVPAAPTVAEPEFTEETGQRTWGEVVRAAAVPAGLIWIIGSLSMAAVLIGSNSIFYRKLRRERVFLEKSAFGKGWLPIYKLEELASPCLFGLLKPAIYVTSSVCEESARLKYVISHEQCHFRRGDHIWALLRGLCLAVWWWNPLVWLAARASVQDGELACDEAVIRMLGEERRLEYGETLINMIPLRTKHVNLLCNATSMGNSKESIRERLLFITTGQKPRLWVAVEVVVLVAVLLVVTLTGPSTDGISKEDPRWEPFLEELEATYAENPETLVYNVVTEPEFRILSAAECPTDTMGYLYYTGDDLVAVVEMEQTVFFTNETLSLGPQWGSGIWTTRFYIREVEGQLEVADWDIPFVEENVLDPSEENAEAEVKALIEELGITYSQYRDMSHQLLALLGAKVDHDFTSYLDFSPEEYRRYMFGRAEYFKGFVWEDAYSGQSEMFVKTGDLAYIQCYDFSNDLLGGNADTFSFPEFVDGEAENYNCSQKLDDSKDDLRVEVLDVYVLGENLIGQRVRIIHQMTGEIKEMEYQFRYEPDAQDSIFSSRIYIAGGRVLEVYF